MSTSPDDAPTESETDDETDPWERLAAHSDVLEMCVEEEVPFADRAQQLLDRLEEEGYR